MKINLLGKPEIIISNPYSKHNYFGWPSIIKFNDNKIIAGASGFRLGHVCPFGKGVISYSSDNGNTFSPPVVVIDTPLDDRDVGLCAFSDNGLIVTSFNNTRKMQHSYAEGKSEIRKKYHYAYLDMIKDDEENEFIGSTFRISFDKGISFGEIYKCPVTSPHGPIQLKDGTILWVGYEFHTDDDENSTDVLKAYLINPNDGSSEYIGTIPDIYENNVRLTPTEPYAVELPDGTIVCHIRIEETFTTYQTVSSDKGKTWSVPERILDDHGGAPCHLLLHSSGVLISTYSYREAPYEIRAMFSFDNGKNWDKNHTIYTNGISDDLGYPCSVELDNGDILTVFYAKTKENSPCVILKQKWNFTL